MEHEPFDSLVHNTTMSHGISSPSFTWDEGHIRIGNQDMYTMSPTCRSFDLISVRRSPRRTRTMLLFAVFPLAKRIETTLSLL